MTISMTAPTPRKSDRRAKAGDYDVILINVTDEGEGTYSRASRRDSDGVIVLWARARGQEIAGYIEREGNHVRRDYTRETRACLTTPRSPNGGTYYSCTDSALGALGRWQ